MRFHSVATPHPDSNAVGPLELRCTDHELIVYHQSVRRRTPDAPLGPVVSGTQTRIPWAEVKAQQQGNNHLFLDLGPHRTPLNRFCLTRFSRTGQHGVSAARPRRRSWWLALFCFAVLTGVVTIGYTWPSGTLHLGALVAAGFIAASLLLLTLVGVATRHRWTIRPQSSQKVLTELIAQLDPLLPKPVGTSTAPSQLDSVATDSSILGGRPGAGWAIAGAVAATALTAWLTWFDTQTDSRFTDSTGGLGTVQNAKQPFGSTSALNSAVKVRKLSVQPTQIGASDETPAANPSAIKETTANSKSAASPEIAAAQQPASDSVQWGESCHCPRADSALWATATPRLSTLILSRKTRRARGVSQTRMQLGIVNNGNRNLRDIAVSVHFEAPGSGNSHQNAAKVVRHLFYAGPLRPGRAVKWKVEGPGKDFQITAPEFGTLEIDGSDTALPSEFIKLTEAENRSVRLHAVRMLAYLGESSAWETSMNLLNEGRADEAAFLRRVRAAAAPVYACNVKTLNSFPGASSMQACIFNRSNRSISPLALKLKTLTGPVAANAPTALSPAVAGESQQKLLGSLSPISGRLVTFRLSPNMAASTHALHFDTVVTLDPASL